MECNKDDAIKAREIAERKFDAKDLPGAKKFALKAQNLYPGLEGISQMLATLDVYAAAEDPVLGEADFYGVLGVTPKSDDDTIRKQYRKLALMLHPDKNKSIGAEGAFKLISEAWSLLSDRNRRAAYDSRRNIRGFSQKTKPPSQSSSVPPGANGFYNFAKATMSNPKVNKNASPSNGSSVPGSSKKANQNSFWTVCHRCKMQYEYLRCYLNHNLRCPNCRKPFFAIETPPPVSNGSESSKPREDFQHWQNSQQEARNKSSHNAGHNTDNSQWTPFSGAAGVSSVSQAANVVQQTYEKVKRVREEAQAARKREKAKRKNDASGEMIGSSSEKKKRVSDDSNMNNDHMGLGGAGVGISSTIPAPRHSGTRWSGSVYANRIGELNRTRELSQSELRSILMHKARKEILTKIAEWNSASMLNNAAQKEIATKKSHDKDNRQENVVINGNLGMKSSKSADSGLVSEDNSLLSVTQDRLSIPVPDPEFYDFDKDRTERAFGENQVWAVYDNDDGMPRFYAMVQSVISRDPFRIRISWLNSTTNTELGPLNWVGSGFSKTCGDFRVGRHEKNDGLNCFSHKVRWTKGSRGAICIFPRKGDVCALYRNWSPDWNELTDDEVIHKYDMVEVLEDYDEELGVVVIPLVKVAGFKAVFHHHLDSKQVRRIPKEEIFRFSYQLPSHLLSGHESPNAPKGCRELDPAALPPEFLQVIADAKDIDIVENQATERVDIVDDDDEKPRDRGMRNTAETKDHLPPIRKRKRKPAAQHCKRFRSYSTEV
ncbi:uncharacterized protein LOC110690540 [Chenopodium quinoa]|uniref:uncharacterized protein LOC110690540 n=1 Tax=Chenopodium quinoa TaxID=63459 RepID=UPI000B7855B9|nr:uncharacterized protein LOC110690540 [Chenopodium quinoa]